MPSPSSPAPLTPAAIHGPEVISRYAGQAGQGCRGQDRSQEPAGAEQHACRRQPAAARIGAETTSGFGHLFADAAAHLAEPQPGKRTTLLGRPAERRPNAVPGPGQPSARTRRFRHGNRLGRVQPGQQLGVGQHFGQDGADRFLDSGGDGFVQSVGQAVEYRIETLNLLGQALARAGRSSSVALMVILPSRLLKFALPAPRPTANRWPCPFRFSG